jgi:hypothetical protein
MEDPLADIERIRALPDPAERAREIGRVLNALPAITTELRVMRQSALQELRAGGWSLAQIGEALGLHRNRVQQIMEGRSGGDRRGHAAAGGASDT